MLSALAQGCGAWDGSTASDKSAFPTINIPSEHKHGVTIKSARHKKSSIIRVEEIDGALPMPKTYLTRKGALVLYSSKKSNKHEVDVAKPIDVEKVIQRLGNVRRLMASVLYLNDGQMPDADISVSDERNEVFVGFIKTIDSVLYKQRIQPGHDLNFYLKTLRMRARNLSAFAGSDLAEQINALLCTPVASSRPSTSGTNATAASSKLSSAKLTASLKSDSYMGRKIVYPALDPTIYNFSNTDTPFSTTWPGYSQLHEASGTDKINSDTSRPTTESGGPRSKRSTLSVADGREASKARSTSAISTNTSGSLADDPTLFEEVDIPVDEGLEADSDLENEYFQPGDLPSKQANRLKKRKQSAHSSSSERHLINTPDAERSFIGVEVKDNVPITPEITLRSGTSDVFNIAQSQIEVGQPDVDVSLQKDTFSASSDKELPSVKKPSLPHSPRSNDPQQGEGQHSTSSASTGSATFSEQMDDIMYVKVTPNQRVSINDLPRLVPKVNGKMNNNVEKTTPEPMLRSESADAERRGSRRESSTSSEAVELSRRSSSALASKVSTDDGSLQLPTSEAVPSTPPTSPFISDTHSLTSTPEAKEDKRVSVHNLKVKVKETGDEITANVPKDKETKPTTDDTFRVKVEDVKPANSGNVKVEKEDAVASHAEVPEKPQPLFEKVTRPAVLPVVASKPDDLMNRQVINKRPSPLIAEGDSKKSPPRPQTAKATATPLVNITHLPTEAAGSTQKSAAFIPRHVPEKPKTPKVRDADKEALKKEEKLREDEQKALEVLMKDPDEVKEMLASNMIEDFDEGGLTLEEMELAREMLDQKLAEAEKGIEQQLSARKPSDKTNSKSKGSNSKSAESSAKDLSKEKKKELMEKRERVRQAKRLAQQRRTAEKKALQEMILVKAKEEHAFIAEEERRIKEIMEREKYMNAIAEEARQQEEEARLALAKSRRQAKAEREQRRKEELERRKEEAIRRYLYGRSGGREEQKRMQDSARQKELDMLEQISDAETVRHLREQERKRKEEEEWKLQAKLMEEERLSSLQAEDEEVRIANIEREAEESAMARLVEERMEAERKEREIEQQRRELQELENERRAYLEREKQKIEEELKRQEEEEEREREAERLRVLELKRLEEEAREQMLRDIEERRAQLIKLRELNIEKKRNLETIKKNQAYTKPWVFSYYVKWPRETYERLIGGDDKKRRPVPRKKQASKS